MTSGSVNWLLEAILPVTLVASDGATDDSIAIIDTGFSGYLTLPFAKIHALGYSWLFRSEAILGDGSIQSFDVYEAFIVWEGRKRRIQVEAADTDPLLGMSLLYRHELRIHVISSGLVQVDALP